jgi:hypothetical protein
MSEIIELTTNNTFQLPPTIAAEFQPNDRFMIWVEGDMVYLKRITPGAITNKVAQTPDEHPLSLEEINEIVHEVRQSYQTE